MSLNWNAEAVKDYKKIDEEPILDRLPAERANMRHVMDALIWSMLDVGMSSITEENAQRFYNRLDVVQRLYGPKLKWWPELKDGEGARNAEPFPLTLEHVKRFIGLKTNVTNESLPTWRARILSSRSRDFPGGF